MSGRNKEKKISIKRRVIISVLILILGTIVSCFVLAVTSLVSDIKQRNDEISSILDNYTEYSDSLFGMIQSSTNIEYENLSKRAALTASALRRTYNEGNSEGEGTGVKLYKDGCLFRSDGTDTEMPAGLPSNLNTSAICPESDDGVTMDYDAEENTGGKYAVAYFRIKDDLYYMEWAPLEEPSDTEGVEWDSLLRSIADTYRISVIEMAQEDTGDLSIVGGDNKFTSYDTAEELGLTRELVEESMNGKSQLVRLKNDYYFMQSQNHLWDGAEDGEEEDLTMSTQLIVSALVPVQSIYEYFGSAFLTFLLIMIILGVALIVWIVLAYRAVSNGPTQEVNIEKLKPSEMMKKVIVYIVLSTLIIGCCCAFSHALSNLLIESTHASRALKNISKSINVSSKGSKSVWEESKKEYIDEAQKIAGILDEYPQVRNSEWLKEVSGIIGADYIMLFDANGDEMLTDSRYRQMFLGRDESSATYDFRRLLKGVNDISLEKVTDEITGLKRDMYGVPLKYAGAEENAYGALIIAVNPKTRLTADITERLSDINALLHAHSVGDNVSFAVDPETGKVKYSSDSGITGKNAVTLGLDERSLKSSFIGFFDLNSEKRFGRSAEKGDLLYYYSSKRDHMFSGTGSFTETCMILYLIIMFLLMFVLMCGYTDEVYEKMMAGKDRKDADQNRKPGYIGGKVFSALGIRGGPFRKAMMTLMILAAVVVLLVLITSMHHDGSSGSESVISYIMNGDWDRGINIFAMTAAFLIACNAVVIIALLYAVRVILNSVLNARGSTICSLITGIMQYLTAIIATFMALGFFGVDYKAILASLGIISMAVTLGAKDFFADIFAGINLLTNNAYQMGDLVEIAGYRGRVREVNLRTTKLTGSGGNVKTIRNSTIVDVINYSANNSLYTAEITVSISNDLSEMEAMLNRELPEIGKKYPQFINGPEFKGISSMGGGRETLLIQTECKQKDYRYVVNTVNKELQQLFRNNGIEIL